MRTKTVIDFDPKGKVVLLRVDFNVPLTDGGKVDDDFRMRSGGLETIRNLSERGAKVVVISHFKRPDGWDEALTLEPVAQHLGELLKRRFLVVDALEKVTEYDVPHVFFIKNNIEKDNVRSFLDNMSGGDVAVLENIRFYDGEKKNGPELVSKLAALGDVFVNDGFAVSHRNHASVVGLAEELPAYAGGELIREMQALDKILNSPQKPFLMMIGGMKLETKVDALLHLAKNADQILVGGGMANILLVAKGYDVGKSVYDEGELGTAKRIIRDYKDIVKLPRDFIVSTDPDGEPELVEIDKVKKHQMILDVGPETIKEYSKYIREAKTILWNGPLGLFEKKQFSHGTYALARFLTSRTKGAAYGVAGGGETLQVIAKDGLTQNIDHVSTGGGAMLEYLAGKELPGIEVLKK